MRLLDIRSLYYNKRSIYELVQIYHWCSWTLNEKENLLDLLRAIQGH